MADDLDAKVAWLNDRSEPDADLHRPTFPLMTELFARPGVPMPPDEPYETNASYETADAQHIVAALDRQTEQLRIANLIAFEVISGEKNRAEIRKGLSL